MEQQQETEKKKGGHKWLHLKYHRLLVKNIPFYLFAGGLAILYIANGHYADKMMKEIRNTSKDVREMGYEFKTTKQKVIFRSKESELAKAVELLGLHSLVAPPVLIRDTLKPE